MMMMMMMMMGCYKNRVSIVLYRLIHLLLLCTFTRLHSTLLNDHDSKRRDSFSLLFDSEATIFEKEKFKPVPAYNTV